MTDKPGQLVRISFIVLAKRCNAARFVVQGAHTMFYAKNIIYMFYFLIWGIFYDYDIVFLPANICPVTVQVALSSWWQRVILNETATYSHILFTEVWELLLSFLFRYFTTNVLDYTCRGIAVDRIDVREILLTSQ